MRTQSYGHRIFAAEGEEVVSVRIKKGLGLSPPIEKTMITTLIRINTYG